jgi:CMP-N,N'-diacetyllegionaminic acid synthase
VEEENNMNNAVAVILARGGSKRIPLKNIKKVGGKPLISYPIDLCKKCDHINRIIVSTDHPEISKIAKNSGAEVPFIRPDDISKDVASELVTMHALDFLYKNEKVYPDYCVTLTPATPFIGIDTLNKAFSMIESNSNLYSVTTIKKAELHPEWMLNLDHKTGEITTILGNSLDGKYNVSQNLKTHYYPTGAFWINKVDVFMDNPSLYGSSCGGVLVSDREAIDIDWPEELEHARLLA